MRAGLGCPDRFCGFHPALWTVSARLAPQDRAVVANGPAPPLPGRHSGVETLVSLPDAADE
tara:strand:- start:867 stop:1049 length:183 start_codon:yes stop_codon:yes gene_type:complete